MADFSPEQAARVIAASRLLARGADAAAVRALCDVPEKNVRTSPEAFVSAVLADADNVATFASWKRT